MTRPLLRKDLPKTCICGHPWEYHGPKDEHTGECTNNRCECKEYIELCPLCSHRQPRHDGAKGECTVIKQSTRGMCGCRHYA